MPSRSLPIRRLTRAQLRFFFYVARVPLPVLPAITIYTGNEIRQATRGWNLRRDSEEDLEWRAEAGTYIRKVLDLPLSLQTLHYSRNLVVQGQRRLRRCVEEQDIPWDIIDRAGSNKRSAAALIAYASVPGQAPALRWFRDWKNVDDW